MFKLDRNLYDLIIEGLENQSETFAFDTERLALSKLENLDTQSGTSENDSKRFIPLPKWGSEEGFSLRVSFIKNLRGSFIKKSLEKALYSGRGAFKEFKKTLKTYPHIDKLWHTFKTRKMENIVNAWYNEICVSRGLETLSLNEDELSLEDYSELVQSDFTLTRTIPVAFSPDAPLFLTETEEDAPHAVRCAIAELLRERTRASIEKVRVGEGNALFFTLSSQDVAGLIISMRDQNFEENKVSFLDSFFVFQEYRGLGLGTTLLESLIESLRKSGTKYLVLGNLFPSETLVSLLKKAGFVKLANVYFLSLKENIKENQNE